MTPEIDLELIRSLSEFRYVLRTFLAASEALSKAAGVTVVHYQAMLAICAWEGPMTVGDLADQLMLTHSAAVQTVDRLAAAGLVERGVVEDDRRVVLVAPTLKGQHLIARLARQHLEELLRRERELRVVLRRIKAVAHSGYSTKENVSCRP